MNATEQVAAARAEIARRREAQPGVWDPTFVLGVLDDADATLDRHAPDRQEGLTCEDGDCPLCLHGDGHTADVCDECHDWEGGMTYWPCRDALAVIKRYAPQDPA